MPQTQNSAGAVVFRSEQRRLIGVRRSLSRCSVAGVAAVIQPGRNSAGAAENRLKRKEVFNHEDTKTQISLFVPLWLKFCVIAHLTIKLEPVVSFL